MVENSEVVRLNNRTLTRDTDYTINYVTGRLKFIGDAENEVSDPSSDLDISYQTKDQFGFGQSKSLLGVRLERPFDDQYSLIGMTLLYGTQSTASPRVRVGQEPTPHDFVGCQCALPDATQTIERSRQFNSTREHTGPVVYRYGL